MAVKNIKPRARQLWRRSVNKSPIQHRERTFCQIPQCAFENFTALLAQWRGALLVILAASMTVASQQAEAGWPAEPYLTWRVSTANSTIYDFGDVPVPEAGLLIVVASGRGTSANTRNVSSVSIDGTNGAENANGTPLNTTGAIFSREVEPGDRNVTVTFSGAMIQAEITVYLLPRGSYLSSYEFDEAYESSNSTSVDIPLDFPAGGLAIYGAFRPGNNITTTWSAAEKEADAWNENHRFSTAWKVASGNNTETVSWDEANNSMAVAAVWVPSVAARHREYHASDSIRVEQPFLAMEK